MFPSASMILATANTTAVTIDSSQNVTIAGNLTVNKAITFNETSVDADFRVESNGNANMLFVDGGADRIGIGQGSPNTQLDVKSGGDNHGIYLEASGDTTELARLIQESTDAGRFILKDGGSK